MIKQIKKFFSRVKEYSRIAHIGEIARRYFAMNSFDGLLTILGVLIGTHLAHVTEPHVIINTGIGASIAMGVSGIWGTYLTEIAERKRHLHELGRATLNQNLKNSKIGRAATAASLIVATIDGLAPFFSALIVIVPFFFTSVLTMTTAYYIAVSISFVMLMGLGAYLGHISKESILLNGFKMVLAGVVCVALVLLLGGA